ncbi:hypothetical protein M9458_024301, partial [Cirrhinus mrigala]
LRPLPHALAEACSRDAARVQHACDGCGGFAWHISLNGCTSAARPACNAFHVRFFTVPKGRVTDDSLASQSSSLRRSQRVPLRVELPSVQDVVVVSRRGRGRLESPPCNRYAGDWSVCGRDFLSNDEADYDEVAGSESDDDMEEPKKRDVWTSPDGLYVDDFALDFDAPFT